jgi:long-subunit acyl-CoA synthetase (AMP-forming)
VPWDSIRRQETSSETTPNLRDYAEACRDFSWDTARQAMDGLPGGALNIAHEAIDRHVTHGHGDRVALRWLSKGADRRNFTYAELAASDEFVVLQTRPDDMALLHFTSGTTGRPKGAIHGHEAAVAHNITGWRWTSIPRTGSGAPPIPTGRPAA